MAEICKGPVETSELVKGVSCEKMGSDVATVGPAVAEVLMGQHGVTFIGGNEPVLRVPCKVLKGMSDVVVTHHV